MHTYFGRPVTTWADGYGTWHALVELRHDINHKPASIRHAARRAIRAQLKIRAPRGEALPSTRIEAVSHIKPSPGTDGVAHFKER